MTKTHNDPEELVRRVAHDGMSLAVGGFGLSGVPITLIDALRRSGVRDLTVISNNMGVDGKGLGVLLESGQVSKVVASYVGENKLFAELVLSGEVDIEFVPQGTLAERLRAGGAGIAAFFTRTGVGTSVAEGKPTETFDGQQYVLERAIVPDLALVRAHAADREGNLLYRYAARNFNPLVAMAGRVTIAEAERLQESFLGADEVMTPGVFVHHVVPAAPGTKFIENRTVRELADQKVSA